MPNNYADLFRQALADGHLIDSALDLLRQSGAGVIESIKAVRETHGVSLGEAKRLVAESPVWMDARDPHNQLVEEILAAL